MRTLRSLAALVLAALATTACATDPVTGTRARPRLGSDPSDPATPTYRSAPAAASGTLCPAACTRNRDHTRRRLERAAFGLTYLSESDVPFEFVFAAAPRLGRLDDTMLRATFGIAADEPVEVVSLDRFFARHIEQVDPADRTARALVPRYRALKRTLQRLTGATVVYRVGRIAIRCYVVGTDPWGNVVGLATTAVET